MTILREKSTFNFDAAELLIKNNLFAPSVHCSYYSCLQLMIYTLYYFFDISFEQLEVDIQSAKQRQKINSHTYIIRQISNEIQSCSKSEYSLFKRRIGDLKSFRERSDYKNEQIDITKSEKALDIANKIRIQMKEIFNV